MNLILLVIGGVLALIGILQYIFKIEIARSKLFGVPTYFLYDFVGEKMMAYITGTIFLVVGIIILILGFYI